MKYRFHPLADEELGKAADYYEEQQDRLGLEFAEEVYSTVQRIVDFPELTEDDVYASLAYAADKERRTAVIY